MSPSPLVLTAWVRPLACDVLLMSTLHPTHISLGTAGPCHFWWNSFSYPWLRIWKCCCWSSFLSKSWKCLFDFILVARLLHTENLYLIKEIACVTASIVGQSASSWERIPVSDSGNRAWVRRASLDFRPCGDMAFKIPPNHQKQWLGLGMESWDTSDFLLVLL